MSPRYRLRLFALLALLLSLYLFLAGRAAAQASGEVAVLQPLPVGVLLRGQDTGQVIIVLGSEQNGQAVDFGSWRLSLQDVLTTLQVESRPSANDQNVLELTSPFLRTTLDTTRLRETPELGLSVTAAQVSDIFSTPLSFDSSVFAVNFEAPEPGASVRQAETLPPLSLEGLQTFAPPPATLSSFTQAIDASSTLTLVDPSLSAETQISGGLLGGSYYLRLDETNLLSPSDWILDELRYTLPQEDFTATLGLYDPFWNLDEDFAGGTVTYRQGYDPAEDDLGSSDLLPRDIVGDAPPGSVVRLVEANRETVILSELLVDSNGLYRFEDVPSSGDETRYTVLIYPGGLLSAVPLRREYTFQGISGQLPVGALSLTAAAGIERTFPQEVEGEVISSALPVLGAYGGLEGGLALRYGVVEQLTLGAGVVYDDGLRAYGEGFFAPDGLPLTIAVQGTSPSLTQLLADDDAEHAEQFALDGRLDYSPFESLYVEGVASETLQRFGVRYNPIDELQLRADVDSADLAIVGLRLLNYPLWRLQTYADFEINPEAEFRWSFSLRDPEIGVSLRQSGNESGVDTTLAYTVPEAVDEDVFGEGHELRLENSLRYEDFSLVWNPVYTYTSPRRAVAGQPFYGLQVGYTFGDTEPSLNASGRVSLVGGLYIDGSYQGLFTPATDRVTLGLTGSYTLGGDGLVPSSGISSQAESGVIVTAFFDRNADGEQDPDEALYSENLELFVDLNRIDNTAVNVSANDIVAGVVQVRAAPGRYRLDLDPAGYPLNFSPNQSSYAVRIEPGIYTTVEVPLNPSFSRIGVLRDASGNPIAGARVEAVSDTGQTAFSITSAAGVYYLDGLEFGSYRLQVLGEPTTPGTLTLTKDSEPYAELDLATTAFEEN